MKKNDTRVSRVDTHDSGNVFGNLLLGLSILGVVLEPICNQFYGPTFNYFFPYRPPVSAILIDYVAALIIGTVIVVGLPLRVQRIIVAAVAILAVWQICIALEPLWYGRNDPPFLAAVFSIAVSLFWVTLRLHWLRRGLELMFLFVLCVSLWKAGTVWNFSRVLPNRLPQRAGQIFFQESSSPSYGSNNLGKAAGKVVVFVVFDELDQHLTFEAGFRHPEFDRMAANSLMSTDVFPSHYRTLAAIPSMLEGRSFRLSDLDRNSIIEGWGSSSIFRDLRRAGIESAVLGWYHPYCTILNNDVAQCFSAQWDTPGTAAYLSGAPLYLRLKSDLGTIVRSIPLVVPTVRFLSRSTGRAGTEENAQAHRAIYQQIRSRIGDFLRGSQRFFFLHLPVPHTPAIRVLNGSLGGDYLDNLDLADETMGLIRRSLEDDNRWSDSIVLVMGDHHFRYDLWRDQASKRVIQATGKEDTRTVFLLKLPGDKSGAMYHKPFDATLVHDLIENLALDRLTTREQVIAWLDANRTRFAVGRLPRN